MFSFFGCVMAELLLGQPLLPGESGVDQLEEIIKVLGTTIREEIKCMNPNYTEFKFPQIKANPWHKIFCKCMLLEAVDLVSRLLQYSPNLRCTVLDSNVYSSYLTLLRKNKKTFKLEILFAPWNEAGPLGHKEMWSTES
ncbi:hypothetical protein PTKIN_Ptkin15bG0068400 [Pterospermum kingtungense]